MARGPEGDFWKAVRKAWVARGWHAVRVEASCGGCDPGTPDTVFGCHGRNGWVELKVWPDPLSAIQQAWHEEALEGGSYAMVLCQLRGGVWLGRWDEYMSHFSVTWPLASKEPKVSVVKLPPDPMHLHEALSMIESALSRR